MDLTNLTELKGDWNKILRYVEDQFGMEADLQAVLFLIGIQELGKGPGSYNKQEKQDLMHIATCRLLSTYGFYELLGHDEDGWPHWFHSKPIPKLSLKEQDILLKQSAITYFETEVWKEVSG